MSRIEVDMVSERTILAVRTAKIELELERGGVKAETLKIRKFYESVVNGLIPN